MRAYLKSHLRSGMYQALSRLYAEAKLGQLHRRSLNRAARATWPSPLKLHCGCGDNLKPGWVNIDPLNKRADLQLDLRESLPFHDNSASIIYSEHFFEHLEYPTEVNKFLAESLRILIAGGEFRVVVPDTEWPLLSYAKADAEYFDLARAKWHPAWCNTRMHNINYHFRQGSEHKYAYDFETMAAVLRKAGFASIEHREFDPVIDTAQRKIGSLYVSAFKQTVS
jgi:predicted SAM-dependent methyltransferase